LLFYSHFTGYASHASQSKALPPAGGCLRPHLPAQADLKSFFHGDPPPFVKAPPPKQLATVSTAAGAAADAQVEAFMRTLATAIFTRDATALLARLSERYVVDDAPGGMQASEFMAQAAGKMRGPTEIVIQSVHAQGAERIAKAEFRYGADKTSLKTFRFDSGGKLLHSDLFALTRISP
jgi:hypothetical protein